MSKELVITLGQSGLTVTASVYLLGVLKASGIACPEIGVTGAYAGDFTATPNVAGVYNVEFFASGSTISSGGGQIVWNGTKELTVADVAGAGAFTWAYTLTNLVTGLPIADADVWVTSDAGGANVLASGRTNANGVVTFFLDAGTTVYVWRQKSGFNFTNPDQETVA
ncbi:MAG TPA: hypothetical protein VLH12_08760 [Usitatibacter sp.]|nr:hypothetical protein [Usitatibacter sp.]